MTEQIKRHYIVNADEHDDWYVLAADHDAALAARDARIAELSAALARLVSAARDVDTGYMDHAIEQTDNALAGQQPAAVAHGLAAQIIEAQKSVNEWPEDMRKRYGVDQLPKLEEFMDIVTPARMAELEAELQAPKAQNPPAVAVVMPERKKVPKILLANYHEAIGWNTACEKFTRLNRHPVPLELLGRVIRLLDAEDIRGPSIDELRAILEAGKS